MFGQFNRVLLTHRSNMNEYCAASSGLLDDRFGHKLALLNRHAKHFARRTKRIQAVHTFFNQEVRQLAHRLHIRRAVRSKQRGHSCGNAK